jgi:hypothetical protein
MDFEPELKKAVAFHRDGKADEAEAIYRRVIEQQPRNHNALHLLGVVAAQDGRSEEAAALIATSLEIHPDFAEGWVNLAMVQARLGRDEDALASFDRSLALGPGNADLLRRRGDLLLKLRRFDDAQASYERALAIEPGAASALKNRGAALLKLGRYAPALQSLEAALALDGEDAQALSNRGVALSKLGRLGDALSSFDAALKLQPFYAAAINNRGLVLEAMDRHEEALRHYERAVDIDPGYADAWNNKGNAVLALNRPEAALSDYARALAANPKLVDAFNNRGNALMALKRLDEAIGDYDRALAISPDYADAHLNRGVCLLLSGDFRRGLPEYEWRWKAERLAGRMPDFPRPLWLGEPEIAGKTILVHAEQGLGDTLQFCRYIPMLAERGAKVVFQVQKPLAPLIAAGLKGGAQVIARGDALPHFDLHCPLMSLPLAFGTTLESIPHEVPYLTPDPERAAVWRARLEGTDSPRIGIAWAGNPDNRNDRHRSLALKQMAPLLDLGAAFFSLQKELGGDEREWTAGRAGFHHFGCDFTDTAALAAQMDVVITVDTSIAHLAGALGKPVWILLPYRGLDWRWMTARADSPWYPGARLFRQPKIGDWHSVIREVAAELEKLCRPPRTGPAAAPFQEAYRLHLDGKLDEADARYRAIAAREPANHDVLHLIGVIATQRERYDEALRWFDAALAVRPDFAEALDNRGFARSRMGDDSAALADYGKALALRPDYPHALGHRGNAHFRSRRFAEAFADFDRLTAAAPDDAEAWFQRGNSLLKLKRYGEALASYDRALGHAPRRPAAFNNRGNALLALMRPGDALASYRSALALDAGHAEARSGAALCHLMLGDFAPGWREFEWRWKTEAMAGQERAFEPPQWRGEPGLAGKTILLHAEQGLGDTLQFCRYARAVAALGARVVLEVQPSLKSLLSRLDGAATVVARGEPLPDFDLHCPLLSLPLAFATTLGTVPAGVPYLAADPARTEVWRGKLGGGAAPRIGLVWSGNRNHPNDVNRSMPPERLAPLFATGAAFVALHKETGGAERDWMAAHGILDAGAGLTDFSETAALVSLLDLVISVDTAVAHLAGAMNKPVAVVLPATGLDWRWMLERADSPWYPSARLFRQSAPGDWDGAVAEIAAAVAKLPGHRRE